MPKKSYGCSGFRIVLFPNPADDIVTVKVLEDDTLIDKPDSNEQPNYTIRIFNRQGILKSSFARSGDTFSIPLTNIGKGTYIVEVSKGENVAHQQLIVNN